MIFAEARNYYSLRKSILKVKAKLEPNPEGGKLISVFCVKDPYTLFEKFFIFWILLVKMANATHGTCRDPAEVKKNHFYSNTP